METGVKPAKILYTYRDYRSLPDDGRRYELMTGDLFVTPAPSSFHQTVSRRLQHALMTQLEDTDLALVFDAPIDVILSDNDVVQPDLAIVSAARRDLVSQRGIEGPPDIVVEILSPSTRDRDMHIKRSIYARFGVGEYWIIDPSVGSIEQLTLSAGGYDVHRRFDRASTLASPAFAEISVPLAAVFRPI